MCWLPVSCHSCTFTLLWQTGSPFQLNPALAEPCPSTGQHLSAASACRDIKPENLFLTGTGALRVGDFGLALNFRQEAARSRVGTLDYMAPEVGTGVLQGNIASTWFTGSTCW